MENLYHTTTVVGLESLPGSVGVVAGPSSLGNPTIIIYSRLDLGRLATT